MNGLLPEREVADLLGCSRRWVRAQVKAGKLQVECAPVESRNGRPPHLYPLASLPPEAQQRWAERQKIVEIAPAVNSPMGQLALGLTIPAGCNLGVEDRAEAEKRYQIIEPLLLENRERFRLLWAQAGNRKVALVELLAQQHATKPRTIYHWLQAFQTGGLPALVKRGRADKGRSHALNPAALDFLLAGALPRQGAYGALSVREIHRAYQEERAWRAAHAGQVLGEFDLRKYARYVDSDGRLAESAQLPEAAYRTFSRWFDRIPEIVRVMAREGEEAFHNTQEILSFRDLAAIQPLDYLVMDHRRLDLFCLVKTASGWKNVRPWLTAAIDMRTRKWLAWVIVETPSSDSIAAVLKRAFLDHGLPGACYWDNGKDFTCEWLEGRHPRAGNSYRVAELGTAMRGVLETFGVRVHHAIIKRARSKIIEPNFGNTANFDRTLPWWCGHKPAARPERFDKLVEQHEAWTKGEAAETPFPTIEAVAWYYDEFLTSLNARPHTGVGMEKLTPSGRGWMSPDECWNSLIGSVERRSVPAEAIQFCFAKRRVLTVRNGEVQPSFGGRMHHYRLLANPVALAALNGREIAFAYDPHDLGTAAVYYQDRFVGLVENVELRRMGEEGFVADERERRAMRREVKAFISGVHQRVYIPTPGDRAQRRMAARAVAPESAELPRVEAPARLPAGVAAAAAAQTAEQAFSFANAEPSGVDLVRAADAAAYRDSDDGEFRFFAEG